MGEGLKSISTSFSNLAPGDSLSAKHFCRIFSSPYLNDTVQRSNWLQTNIFGSLSRNMFKIEIDIQGATNNIGAGHVVNFIAPSGLEKKMLPGKSNPLSDEYHSGKYFVFGVKHNITLTNYIKKL
jgi:hypothetical protein